MVETEVKLRTDDLASVRRKLQSLGARLKERVEEERDLMFRPASGEGLDGEVLRLRLAGGEGTLTWKGRPSFEDGVKRREELQTSVSDPAATRDLLEKLGYVVSLDFSKRREYWDLRGLAVSLDELEFGSFVEVEGDPAHLERAVEELGLASAERVEEGYPQLAERHSHGGNSDVGEARGSGVR